MMLPTALHPFRHQVFRSIWLANLASNFGALIQTVAAAWMMTIIADTADMVTLVQTAAALPIMLFAVFSGAIADNFNRRRVMLLAQIFMFLVSVTLAVVAYLGLMTPWLLLAFTFLIGSGIALNNPSWHASIAEMVPKADLPAAVALNGMGFNITRGTGPAVGGAIVAAYGVAVAFMVNALSYLALIFVLWRWKPPERTSQLPREALGSAVAAGLRYIALSPHLQLVLLRSFVFGFAVISVLALLPLVAREKLDGDALLYGILVAAFGTGAVAGALVSGFFRERFSTEWSARIAFLGLALCAAALAVVPWAWLVSIALFVGGACWVMALSMFNISVQLSTPRWVVGRALSLYQAASFGGQATGAWVWGLAADAMGQSAALAISAVAMILGAFVGIGRFALPALSSPGLDPSNRWKEPKTGLSITHRSGPITIMIEYRIRNSATSKFLDLMVERRRLKQRNGARNWSLVRDMEDIEQWTEMYGFPSWLEYVRYNQRQTLADAGLTDGIRSLHTGDGPPRVKRLLERPSRWQEGENDAFGTTTDIP